MNTVFLAIFLAQEKWVQRNIIYLVRYISNGCAAKNAHKHPKEMSMRACNNDRWKRDKLYLIFRIYFDFPFLHFAAPRLFFSWNVFIFISSFLEDMFQTMLIIYYCHPHKQTYNNIYVYAHFKSQLIASSNCNVNYWVVDNKPNRISEYISSLTVAMFLLLLLLVHYKLRPKFVRFLSRRIKPFGGQFVFWTHITILSKHKVRIPSAQKIQRDTIRYVTDQANYCGFVPFFLCVFDRMPKTVHRNRYIISHRLRLMRNQ